MTLVTDARKAAQWPRDYPEDTELILKLADRIEELEAALREIADQSSNAARAAPDVLARRALTQAS